MAKPQIEPKVLKGFRDTLPETAIVRESMIATVTSVFRKFGFVPIDTPALEYAEILLGKGSAETDKQMYRFLDNGDRDVALRFDLTVPLARFVASHIEQLGTPFRRYHVAPVWRAEKPQRGRYREFIQCDFDCIGTTSLLADAEIVSVIHESLSALGIRHRVRINNRVLLNGLLEGIGVADRKVSVLRAIDKLEKLGQEVVTKELMDEAKLNSTQIDSIFSLMSFAKADLKNQDLLKELRSSLGKNEPALRGVAQLEELLPYLAGFGITDEHCKIDLSIARGLDYYTGLVFETTMLDLPTIGSICSGGRYDDLANLYTSRKLPGVGASIGLDRILGAYEELALSSKRASTADILVTVLDQSTASRSAEIAARLRQAGIAAELYPEVDRLGGQLKFGGKRGHRFAVIAGEKELAANTASVKNLITGEQRDGITLSELPQVVTTLLASK